MVTTVTVVVTVSDSQVSRSRVLQTISARTEIPLRGVDDELLPKGVGLTSSSGVFSGCLHLLL